MNILNLFVIYCKNFVSMITTLNVYEGVGLETFLRRDFGSSFALNV